MLQRLTLAGVMATVMALSFALDSPHLRTVSKPLILPAQ